MARIPLVQAAPDDGKSYVQSNGQWVETSAGVGIWSQVKGYGTNDPVQYTDGVVYKAKQWIPPGTAWNINLWVPVSGSAAGTLGGFVPTKQYLKYESIFENGVLYRSRTAFTAGSSFSVGDWEAVGSGGGDGTIGTFDSNKEYKKNQPIYHNMKIYRAKYDFQPAVAFDAVDWELIAENKTAVNWTAGTQVNLGDVVKIEGKNFTSKSSRTTGAKLTVAEYNNWAALDSTSGWAVWTGTVAANVVPNTEVDIGFSTAKTSVFDIAEPFNIIFDLCSGMKISDVDVDKSKFTVTGTKLKVLANIWLEVGDVITLYFK